MRVDRPSSDKIPIVSAESARDAYYEAEMAKVFENGEVGGVWGKIRGAISRILGRNSGSFRQLHFLRSGESMADKANRVRKFLVYLLQQEALIPSPAGRNTLKAKRAVEEKYAFFVNRSLEALCVLLEIPHEIKDLQSEKIKNSIKKEIHVLLGNEAFHLIPNFLK